MTIGSTNTPSALKLWPWLCPTGSFGLVFVFGRQHSHDSFKGLSVGFGFGFQGRWVGFGFLEHAQLCIWLLGAAPPAWPTLRLCLLPED
jgi:hypothetical protein